MSPGSLQLFTQVIPPVYDSGMQERSPVPSGCLVLPNDLVQFFDAGFNLATPIVFLRLFEVVRHIAYKVDKAIECNSDPFEEKGPNGHGADHTGVGTHGISLLVARDCFRL